MWPQPWTWLTTQVKIIIDIDKFEDQTLEDLGLITEIEARYRSTYFGHIFAGDIHQDITVTYGQRYLKLTLLKLLKTKDYSIKKLLINLKNTSIQRVIQMI